MNPLKRGFLDLVEAIRRNKGLFVLLVLVQILFVVSVSYVGVRYHIEIGERVEGVLVPLQEVNYNTTALEAGAPLMGDMMKQMAGIAKSYQEMVEKIVEMVFLLLGCFLLFNGFNWSLANYMVRKGKLLDYWKKFVLVSLAFLLPIGLGAYFVLKNLAVLGWALDLGVKVGGGLFLVVGYFMVVGFCLLRENLGRLFKKIFLLGVWKVHWILLGWILVIFGVILGLVGVYFLMEEGLVLMILSGLFLVVVLVLGKLFLVGLVRELEEKGK